MATIKYADVVMVIKAFEDRYVDEISRVCMNPADAITTKESLEKQIKAGTRPDIIAVWIRKSVKVYM